MKNVLILYSEYLPVIDAIISANNDTKFETMTEIPENLEQFDLIIDVNFVGEINANVLKCHHSLLPAFSGEEPVKEAFLAGVKVTGITIFDTKRIIAQYPIFISDEVHFDDIEKELEYLEQVIFPIVVKKIVANEPANLKTMLSGSKDKCRGCSGCRK